MRVEYFDIVSTLQEKSKTYHKRLKEFNAELHDDRLNFMGLGSVKEIVYFNTEDLWEVSQLDYTDNQRTSFILSLSNRIEKQKRVVYDTFMMLGDVGGLSDLLILIASAIVSVFNEPLMVAK